MRLYTCKICGWKSYSKLYKLTVKTNAFFDKENKPLRKKIDVCDLCILETPNLSTDAFLEDLIRK